MDMALGDTDLIKRTCAAYGLSRPQTAYVLATAYWESARTMAPVREAFWCSEDWRRKNLRYYPWYGRGYVQLTWRANYEKAGARLGIDLLADADLALQAGPAAHILVRGMQEGWFTGKALGAYILEGKTDFMGARRIINGTDRAAEIADLAAQYLKALHQEDSKPSWIAQLFTPKRWDVSRLWRR